MGKRTGAEIRLEQFQRGVEERAREIVEKGLPRKAVEVTALLEQVERLSREPRLEPELVRGDEGARARLMTRSEEIMGMSTRVRDEVATLLKFVESLKLWLRLLQPPASEMETFNSAVHAGLSRELEAVESSSAMVMDSLSTYGLRRASLVELAVRHTVAADYVLALASFDDAHVLAMTRWTNDVRHMHLLIADLLDKNMRGQTPSILSSSGALRRSKDDLFA